ncbi:MAG: GntR family transcriptional regulator [Chloroflexi bacterium]|nr:GntR family transcriptional regulator [Chloroflexota bacterium]
MAERFDRDTVLQISEPTRRSDVVYGAIRNAIIHRRIKSGEWLREAALANELGVSRTMVRDALTRLTAEGLAEEVPYKGVRATSITLDEMGEVYRIRTMLEAWAFELAAQRITEEDLASMRALLPNAVLDPSLVTFERTREANREFHWIAIQASGKRHLVRILEQIWDLIPPDLTYPDLTEEQRYEVAEREMRAHEAIVEALAARDGQRARDLITEHVLGILDYPAPTFLRNQNQQE